MLHFPLTPRECPDALEHCSGGLGRAQGQGELYHHLLLCRGAPRAEVGLFQEQGDSLPIPRENSHSCAEPHCGVAVLHVLPAPQSRAHAFPSSRVTHTTGVHVRAAAAATAGPALSAACSSQSSPGSGEPRLLPRSCYHLGCWAGSCCAQLQQQNCLCQGCGSVPGEILQLSVFSAVLTSTRMLPSSASPVTTAQSTFLLQKTQKEISSQGRVGAILKPWGDLEL